MKILRNKMEELCSQYELKITLENESGATGSKSGGNYTSSDDSDSDSEPHSVPSKWTSSIEVQNIPRGVSKGEVQAYFHEQITGRLAVEKLDRRTFVTRFQKVNGKFIFTKNIS